MVIKNKNILVTGGCGFIGSHLVDALLSKNNKITVVDNLSAGSLENIDQKKVIFIKGDICDLSLMKKLCKDKDIIFHFAAQPDVRKSFTQIYEDLQVNVIGTINVLEAMRENNVKFIVFASSAGTIYGEAKISPVPEEYQLQPISHYGASKAACEVYLSSYSSLFGMDCVSLRYGNIFGPRSTHGVIYDFFHKLKKNSKELEILGNGKQEKSYLYIDDCIKGSLLAAENSKKGFIPYNISSNKTIKVIEIAKIVIEEMGLKNVKLKFTGGKRGWPGDVSKVFPDTRKIESLGFRAEISIEEGIRRYVRYLEENYKKEEKIE
jgi:UDP-glucose 4-epimerase